MAYTISKLAKNNTCLYVGTFDPFTCGHLNLIKQALNDYSFVFVGLGVNDKKNRFYDKYDICNVINQTFETEEMNNAFCFCYDGYTGKIGKQLNVSSLVRGVRNRSDKIEETLIAKYNKTNYGLGTKFYQIKNMGNLSSSYVKDLLKNNKSIAGLVPKTVGDYIIKLK